jgi:CRP-like cAMP-binding protein
MLALSGSTAAIAADAGDTIAVPPSIVADSVWPKGSAQMVARDGAVFAEGDPARSWYRLLSGSLRVFRVLRDGRRHISEFVFPGQFFGFESGDVHSQGAEAIEPASVVAYSCERIEQRLAQDAGARQAIRTLLMDQLAAAQERIMLLGRLNATGRLAAFLLVMAQRRSKLNPLGFVAELPMSRIDIADYLGLTVETVSRTMSALKRKGIIAFAEPENVQLKQSTALERLAMAA